MVSYYIMSLVWTFYFRGAGDKVMTSINSFVSAISVYKDHLKVAIKSNPSDINLQDFVRVKHIIKDIVDIHSLMLQELTEREIEQNNLYEDI